MVFYHPEPSKNGSKCNGEISVCQSFLGFHILMTFHAIHLDTLIKASQFMHLLITLNENLTNQPEPKKKLVSQLFYKKQKRLSMTTEFQVFIFSFKVYGR